MSSEEVGLSQEVREEMEAWDDLDHWASEAVRGANNWLVTIRNAEDEGIKPWSDPYASQEGGSGDDEEEYQGETNGILSYSEGLTAITLADEYADEYGWKRLQGDYYAEDIKQILGTVDDRNKQIPGILAGEDEEPGYTPAPYLPRDLTNNFTDAVSFSTTVLMGALDPEEDVLQEKLVDEDDIKQGLKQNLEWLLDNQIETEGGRAGWAWIGGDTDSYAEYEASIKVHNYFTYSAVIALVDYYDGGLGETSISAIEEMRDEYKDEIEDALRKATDCLQEEWWKEHQMMGNGWAFPDQSSQPNAMSSCYVILGLSYINSKVADKIEGLEIDSEKINEGMNFVWEYIRSVQEDEDQNLWAENKEYQCKLGTTKEESYLDASAPYLFLDTIYEFLNYGVGDIEEIAPEEELRNWADNFAGEVLLKCWAGDEEFSEKGFRHLGVPEQAQENPYDNPTALYTTNVALETFLTNVLWDREEKKTIIHEKARTETLEEETEEGESGESDDTGVQREPSGPQKKTVIVNLDGETESMAGEDYPSAIDHQLETIEEKVDELTDGIEGSGEVDDELLDEIRKRNRTFDDELGYLMMELREAYEDWSTITDVLSNAKQSMIGSSGGEWDEKLKQINLEEFIQYLAKLYHCPDRETYEEEVRMPEERIQWLFVPQRDIVEEVDDWSGDQFADDDQRKSYVEEKVDELIENPWGDKSMKQSVIQFEERYEEEVIGE